MRPDERTLGLLWDMQDNARFAAEIAHGATFDRLRASRMEQPALAKAIGHRGAARQRAEAFRALHPEIAWLDIINLRHRIVHDYRRIDFRIIWDIVETELPSLIEWVDRQLAAAPPDEDDPEHP